MNSETDQGEAVQSAPVLQKSFKAEIVWLLLMLITSGSALVAETGSSGWLLTVVVTAMLVIKSHLVIDHYMEMKKADRRFRMALYAFVVAVVVMVVVSFAFGDWLRKLTTIY
jgi:cytochrome c oxidase subunit IV